MHNPYLLLWLEAPLQAWGHDSKFGRRDSLDFPTKSGVLGLIACAQGMNDAQTDWLAAWADLDMQVAAYLLQDRQGYTLPRQPLLRDFHMAGAGYDLKDPWQALLEPRLSNGKPRTSPGGGAKMTYRYYLQDMAFAVALQAPAQWAQEAAAALQAPVWDLYLGRKNCVPTDFIYQGLFDSAEAALAQGVALAQEKGRSWSFGVLQGEHAGEVITLNDVPLQLGQHKRYRDRRVTVQHWRDEVQG